MNRAGRHLAAAMLVMALAGCASRPSPSPPQVVAPAAATAAPVVLPLSTAAFMEMSASAALLAVRAAALAEQRSRDREVLALARLQKANGRGLAGQLSFAGRRLDLLPAARLLPHHRQSLDELARARDFDAAYLAQQRRLIPFMLDIHRAYAERGRSPTLRPVAKLGKEMLEAEARALAAAE